MDQGNAVEVKNLYKKFNTHRRSTSLKDILSYCERGNKDQKYHDVLNDINFTVKKGEALGIIGRNGSGKSTMLKLITKILRPNSGTVETDGKMACLIELGAGFHPDMTGKENVYINASIFGVPKKTIDARFNDILEFAGIGDHINERVRNYSSGMYLRLAFSVAINVDAQILVIDEILAVGDIQFQNKCLERLHRFKDEGGTIVLVTHSTDQAKEMCDKVLWIDNGYAREYGDAEEVCDHYLKEMVGDQ